MLTRIMFPRVERWINGLKPEFQTKGFVQAALGLLGVFGLPTGFLKVARRKVDAEIVTIADTDIKIGILVGEAATQRERCKELVKIESLLS